MLNLYKKFDKFETENCDCDFIQQQARLPRKVWDPSFVAFIEKEIAKNNSNESEKVSESKDYEREQTFLRYVKGLGLDVSSLQDKKIVDVGCGDGEFIDTLIKEKVTAQAYGIDINLVDERVGKNFNKVDFHTEIPFSNCDLIVSVGAVSNEIWHTEDEEAAMMRLEKIIKNSLDALREQGEIRIYPIQEAFAETPLEGIQEAKRRWDRLMIYVSEKYGVTCQLKPSNVRVSGNTNDLIMESVLIIRKNL